MRHSMRCPRTPLAGVLLLAALPAHASVNLSVACDSSALIAALNLANGAGGGTLSLAAGCTYVLAGPHNGWYGPNALPPIQSAITIEGHGAVLQAVHASGPPPLTAYAFRFFYVSGGMESPAGSLTLHQLTLRGGYSKGGDSEVGGGGAGMGGAIFNQGTLVLDSVALIENTAHGGDHAQTGTLGGGGMGQDGDVAGSGIGGGFGIYPLVGAYPGLGGGGAGGASYGGGGGGAGFLPADNGSDGVAGSHAAGGNGGGRGGLGGPWGTSGDGGTGGYGASYASVGGNGGGFGQGGGGGGIFQGGGGGVGGGGGGGACYCILNGGAAGGFGGGGGFGGAGGFGGGRSEFGMTQPGFGGGFAGAGMGGAIFNHTGTVRLLNVTMARNAARGGDPDGSGLGAAIFNLNGSVDVSFSTIAHNLVAGTNNELVAGGPGDGAVYSLAFGNDIQDGGNSVALLTIANSILDDTAGAASEIVNNVANGYSNAAGLRFAAANLVRSYSNYSFLDAGSVTPGNAGAALGGLQRYAATQIMPLTPQSAAIDAATSCTDVAGAPVAVDARGVARPQSGACDLGAYEADGDYLFADAFE